MIQTQNIMKSKHIIQYFKICFASIVGLILGVSPAQSQMELLPLWEGTVPFQVKSDFEEIWEEKDIIRIRDVHTPTLEIYLPAKRNATGQAVMICPGGGYGILAYDWEGRDVAKLLNANGIAAFVLKYRLPNFETQTNPTMVPLSDAQQGIRLIRKNAAKWNLSEHQIGVMGFSAGGHLACSLSNLYELNATDKESSISARPDFSILVYPVISMGTGEEVHIGSRDNLLGENAGDELRNQFSLAKQVHTDTPPTFILHSVDDQAVPIANSLIYIDALLEHNIDHEAHLYPHGGHGYGLGVEHGRLSAWPKLCVNWIKSLND